MFWGDFFKEILVSTKRSVAKYKIQIIQMQELNSLFFGISAQGLNLTTLDFGIVRVLVAFLSYVEDLPIKCTDTSIQFLLSRA